MKKIVSVILMLVLCMSFITGCQNDSNSNSTNNASTEDESATTNKIAINVAALKGPTAIGMVQIMKNAKAGTALNDYEFTIAGTADEFTTDLIKGDVQIAAIPCNLAANLYNKSAGKVKIIGINTLGVLYILQTGDSIKSIQDLKGKTIYTTGKGTTPEYTLDYLLKSAGLNPEKDVTIEFKSEATEVAAMLATSPNAIAMLPQPYATTVMMQNQNIKIALDVTEQWEKYAGKNSTVVTGVVAVNSDFADKNPQAVQQFIKEYKESVLYVNANVDSAAQLVEDFDIFKATVAKRAIPYCNITFIDGSEMKTKVSTYLKVIFDQNPASIGGVMPADDFYK
ncbi:ABC transporter substrate-binding protein [[Clostridium] fimetarium]|uniref:NitT/TauT family transport system substrate-binding protein n=1 Tax=[Clostridium] fimetarium TaxID=99656 RepID=A0A1I0R3B9_9FIRM|nr:ABC transporter substrate-binding protein [[Clostridium] fimetarium]SEW34843.1 NitT/TauT family transport system substrate-binding protein [[Clostridium] fimetarium]